LLDKKSIKLPDHVYGVILAGGSGTRFWPKSRVKTPKQLCSLDGTGKTLIEYTLDRFENLIPPERRIIVTHKAQVEATKKIVGNKCHNIIAEPDARNTANALALAALEIETLHKSDNAVFISLHADHVIKDVPQLHQSFAAGVSAATMGNLVLLGVKPRYPETGFGYIEAGSELQPSVFKVSSFREKPNLETAEAYIKTGRFLWNTGIFIFPVKHYLSELQHRLPESVRLLKDLVSSISPKSFQSITQEKLSNAYSKLPKISVDHAVLEVSQSVCVVEAHIDWQDIGSWDALGECFGTNKDGNYMDGDILPIETTNCTLSTDGPLISALGVSGLVVAVSKGAVLICPKNRAQDVKLVVEQLAKNGRSDLL
jgi:mannose-1-phosphate guanylyltransferase